MKNNRKNRKKTKMMILHAIFQNDKSQYKNFRVGPERKFLSYIIQRNNEKRKEDRERAQLAVFYAKKLHRIVYPVLEKVQIINKLYPTNSL